MIDHSNVEQVSSTMTEFPMEYMSVLGTRAVAEQTGICLPIPALPIHAQSTTALQTLATRKHGTLAHMLRNLPLDGAPPSYNWSDKRRLWGLRLRSIGRGNMFNTVLNVCMPISIISALMSVILFIVCIVSLFGNHPNFYLGGVVLCLAAVAFGVARIGISAVEMDDGWMNKFKFFSYQYTNSFTQSPELKSFMKDAKEASELKQGDVESYLSQEDNMALMRLYEIVRRGGVGQLKHVVLDGDARELLVRAGDALKSARNGSTQSKTVLITGKCLNE